MNNNEFTITLSHRVIVNLSHVAYPSDPRLSVAKTRIATYTKKTKKPNPTKASMATINKHISENSFTRVYVLYGPERYLITAYRSAFS